MGIDCSMFLFNYILIDFQKKNLINLKKVILPVPILGSGNVSNIYVNEVIFWDSTMEEGSRWGKSWLSWRGQSWWWMYHHSHGPFTGKNGGLAHLLFHTHRSGLHNVFHPLESSLCKIRLNSSSPEAFCSPFHFPFPLQVEFMLLFPLVLQYFVYRVSTV